MFNRARIIDHNIKTLFVIYIALNIFRLEHNISLNNCFVFTLKQLATIQQYNNKPSKTIGSHYSPGSCTGFCFLSTGQRFGSPVKIASSPVQTLIFPVLLTTDERPGALRRRKSCRLARNLLNTSILRPILLNLSRLLTLISPKMTFEPSQLLINVQAQDIRHSEKT